MVSPDLQAARSRARATGAPALRWRVGAALGVALLIVGLLTAIGEVARAAVNQGQSRRAMALARGAAAWRCGFERDRRARDDCVERAASAPPLRLP